MVDIDTLALGDPIVITKYKDDPANRVAIVQSVNEDGRVWVTNMNMPFQGTVSEILHVSELEEFER